MWRNDYPSPMHCLFLIKIGTGWIILLRNYCSRSDRNYFIKYYLGKTSKIGIFIFLPINFIFYFLYFIFKSLLFINLNFIFYTYIYLYFNICFFIYKFHILLFYFFLFLAVRFIKKGRI